MDPNLLTYDADDEKSEDLDLDLKLIEEINFELGICCFCKGDCNPCSQACGHCMRGY
jgi:hypothetical protein